MEVNLRGASTPTTFIRNIDYNARGQRVLIEIGNGAVTTYGYDDITFRLTHLNTMRGTESLQDLFYTYDPAGNITTIRDDALQTIYFNGQVVRPDAEYTYDSIYRLIEADGREHIGQASQPQTTWNDEFRVNLAHPNEGQAMRNYFEFYWYDEVGNIMRFDHKAQNGNWIRGYDYDEDSLIESAKKSNRLSRTVVHPDGQQPITEPYTYDPHGNMTSMPHLPQMEWDFKDQLHHVEKGNEQVYYVYDASGQRTRKVVEKNNGTLIEERIYLGGFEIFRRRNGSGIMLERETLHIMDDKQRIAMVETRTQGDDDSLPQLIRYQFSNHLGSASLELDEQAQIISYEEYTPYGSTSYQAVRSQTETLKRYRYTGMERDEESGLNYYTARYYAPWLCRWTAADPIGLGGGMNAYKYSDNNPIMYSDKKGTDAGTTLDEADRFESITRLRDFIVANKSLSNKYALNTFLEGVDEKYVPGIIDTLKHYGYEYSWWSKTNTEDAIAAIGKYEKEWLTKNDVSVALSLGYKDHRTAMSATDVGALNKQRRKEEAQAALNEGMPYVTSSILAGVSAWVASKITDDPKKITGAAGAGASVSGAFGAWRYAKKQQGSYSPTVVNVPIDEGRQVFLVGPKGPEDTYIIRIKGNRITYENIAPSSGPKNKAHMGVIYNLVNRGYGPYQQGTWWTGTHGTSSGDFGGVHLDETFFRRESGVGKFQGWNVQNVAGKTRESVLTGTLTGFNVFSWCYSSACFVLPPTR